MTARSRVVAGLSEPMVQQTLLFEAIDRGPALILVADEHMQYLAANQIACDVLGYTREELLSLHVSDIAVASEARHLYVDMLRRGVQRGVTQIRTKDGRLLRLAYHASETKVARVTYYVSIGFIDENPAPDLTA